MSGVPPTTLRCSRCGADNNPFASECWICQHPLAPEQTAEKNVPQDESDSPQRRRGDILGGIAFALVAVTTCIVGLGLATIGPGIALVFFLAIAPALLAISFNIWKGSGSQSPVLGTISMVASSLVLAVLGPIQLVAALIITFMIMCSRIL